jgi:hypothetical protein
VLLDVTRLEDLERRDAGRRDQRRAAERALVGHPRRTVALRIAFERDGVEQVRTADERRARQAARDGLGETRQVGGHAEVLLRAAGGEPEARHDLVEDQHDVLPPRELAELAQERRVRRHHHRAAGRGLEDDGRDLVLVQQLLQLVDPVRPRDERGLEIFRRHARRHRNLERIAHGGHDGVVDPVEVALELHDLLAAGGRARDADRERRRLGARHREPYALGARHAFANQLGPADFELAARAVVRALLHLLGDGAHDGRMIVAEHERAVAAPAVDVLVPVDVPLAGAVGVVDVERERREDAAVVGGAARHQLRGALVQRLRLRPAGRVLLLDRLLVCAHGQDPLYFTTLGSQRAMSGNTISIPTPAR